MQTAMFLNGTEDEGDAGMELLAKREVRPAFA